MTRTRRRLPWWVEVGAKEREPFLYSVRQMAANVALLFLSLAFRAGRPK